MRTRLSALLRSLKDKAFRDTFVETEIETLVPFQIRAMRRQRGWNQNELATRAGMAQGRISILENPNYEGAVNVKTLIKLASAFDVGLIVRFAPFSEIAEWSSKMSEVDHNIPDFAAEMATEEACDLDVHASEVRASFFVGARSEWKVITGRGQVAA